MQGAALKRDICFSHLLFCFGRLEFSYWPVQYFVVVPQTGVVCDTAVGARIFPCRTPQKTLAGQLGGGSNSVTAIQAAVWTPFFSIAATKIQQKIDIYKVMFVMFLEEREVLFGYGDPAAECVLEVPAAIRISKSYS
eukprot:2735059-Amphidinium_carterae.1